MSAITIVYIITASISIAVALLLTYLARLSSQVALKENRQKDTDYSSVDFGSSSSIRDLVSDEIRNFVDSKRERQMISEHLAHTFDTVLEKRVDTATRDIKNKYEDILKDGRQNEEVAWKRYEKVLVEKRETEAVIRSIAEGLVVIDSHGKVIMMNPAAEKLLGITSQEKSGKALMEGLKDEQLVSLVKAVPGKADKEIELISQQAETKKVLRASTAVVENENGQTVGMVSVLSDITKQKELDRLKSDFILHASHELRTPLVAIDKSISLLLAKEAGELSSAQREFLSIAERNLKRLSALINDLLDLSKLEQDKLRLEKIKTPIEKVISDSMDAVRLWAESKGISLKRTIEDGLPEIQIDPLRVGQVFVNLLGNAIKFTPEGGTVSVEAKLSAGGDTLVLSVEDTGVGISPENLPRVFDKFYQVGERVSTDISGTGIGLSIAKEIVELHGGAMWAESEHGKGAKFLFTLPLK